MEIPSLHLIYAVTSDLETFIGILPLRLCCKLFLGQIDIGQLTITRPSIFLIE